MLWGEDVICDVAPESEYHIDIPTTNLFNMLVVWTEAVEDPVDDPVEPTRVNVQVEIS